MPKLAIIRDEFHGELNYKCFPFAMLLSGFLKFGTGQTSAYPELSPKQADGYKAFEYRCFDRE